MDSIVYATEPSLEVQVHKLTQSGCDEIFQEKISGSKDDRSQLNLLISKLRKGDTICVVIPFNITDRTYNYNYIFVL